MFARGLHPGTSERLGRAWRTDGVTGYDLTFSVPKSVSALWAMGNADGSSDVAGAAVAAHRAAVQAALTYLDTHAGLSRRGTDGVEQVATQGLVAACFDHRTSRAGDPQLHTHALILNKARCADGVWRTLDGTELFEHKKSAGMIYQAALRSEMRQRLGVAFRDVDENGQAEIRGVPSEVLKLWSKRTQAIDAESGPKISQYEKVLGRSLTASERVAVVKTAVLKTRPGKTHPEITSLHATWTEEATAVGWSAEALQRAAAVALRPAQSTQGLASTPLPLPHDEGWLLEALQTAGQRRAVFSRADVAGQVAAHLPDGGLSAEQVLARVEELTDAALRLAEAVPVGQPVRGVTPRASDPRWATVQVLTAEAQILSLAERGRSGGYGRVDRAALLHAVRAADLDLGQYRAVRHLVGGGDLLSVLTAPAGAGKTSTLGAAAKAWQHAGYRVVGLAPSARAAAELNAATGTQTDTLAKWLHQQTYPDNPLQQHGQAWADVTDRTVLILDEASMASTLDLKRLTLAAARAGAKVVLVGDPAQIGVINGPGGMLAALADAGHGVQLEQIHRFTQSWEREASLQLRAGNPAILAYYRQHDRLHAHCDGEQALEALFTHWTTARNAGQDALMMARTRHEVDALNTRARDAAVDAGDIAGPVTLAGDRPWQAGDLLRTRRNNRNVPLGDSHVRNGDRYRVLGPGPEKGLIVEDLAGRGRVVLPADYLAAHCEYGWASTIDSAQGATADVALVLVRPGLDREHLYVAMTRGRHGNHAHITPDPAADPDHHHHHSREQDPGPSARRAGAELLEDHAVRVLTAALAQSGAQDAAHTALATARRVASDTARTQDAERRAEIRRQRRQPLPVPAEHTRATELLQALKTERERFRNVQRQLWASVRDTTLQLEVAPTWARGRRRSLAASLTDSKSELSQTHVTLAGLDSQVEQQAALVARHSQQRREQEQEQQSRADSAERAGRARTAPVHLARPRPMPQPGQPAGPEPARRTSPLDWGPVLPDHRQDRGLSW